MRLRVWKALGEKNELVACLTVVSLAQGQVEIVTGNLDLDTWLGCFRNNYLGIVPCSLNHDRRSLSQTLGHCHLIVALGNFFHWHLL